MKDNISPEEKLLRLIKGQKSPEAQVLATGGAAPELPKNARMHALISRVRKFLDAEHLQKIILSVFLLAGLYFLVSLVLLIFGWNKASLPKIEPGKPEPAISREAETARKPLDYYLEGAKSRRIFSGESSGQGEAAGAMNAELVKDINLLGIVSGDNPQVIIEDKKNQKTYYVNKGQYFGDFLVEEIQPGKVVLNYKGQRFELYL